MLNKNYVLAGKATFTVQVEPEFARKFELKPHYTYRVTRKEASLRYPEAYFVKLLTGPDNESSYSYLGMLNKRTGEVTLTKASKMTRNSWPVSILVRVMAAMWSDEPNKVEAAGWKVHHEGTCGRCGRTLTTPESVERGIGPECAEIMGIA